MAGTGAAVPGIFDDDRRVSVSIHVDVQVGLGSGLLSVATGETGYWDWTVRLGGWFVDHQFDNGHWENTKFWTPDPTVADKIEITTEFVMHAANIITYLSVR